MPDIEPHALDRRSSQSPMAEMDDDEISLLDLLLTISENIKLLVLGPLLAGLVALGISFTLTPTFTARTSIIPPSSSGGGSTASAILESLGPLAGMAGGAVGLKDPSAAVMAYLDSDTLRDELIAKFDLRKKWESDTQTAARNSLKGAVQVTSDKKNGLLVIEVSDSDPKFAAELANAHVVALKDMMRKIALESAKAQRQFLETQLEEAIKKPYQSPLVRETIIQGLIRQVEAVRMDEARDGPVITQVDIAQPPEVKSKPKKALIAVLTTLASGFALLLFVFIRQALRNGSTDPDTAGKLAQIKKSLRLWR
jgi:uncharacterized protein involved in exopolysaccharide biosynthesis